MRVVWLRKALKNLHDEAEYIGEDNPQAASDIVSKIEAAVERLSAHPALGRAGRVAGTRELVIPSTAYIVPYCVKNGQIVVLRVFHGSRRWPERF